MQLMKRSLMIAAIALATIGIGARPSAAQEQSTFVSKVQLYVDNDHTTVISPIVQAQAVVSDSTIVNAGYVADVVSSASIDVVSQASKTTIHDVRHQVSLGTSHDFEFAKATLGYSFSTEHDYQSNNLSASLEKNLFDKNTVLAVGYALSLDDVGRAGDHNFSKSLNVNSVSFTLTQLFSPKLAGQLTYEYGYSDGFQSSPYRFVPVRATPDASPMYFVPETDPLTRSRNALVLGANWFIPKDSALQADYRLYTDSWGITSHTVGLRYIVNLTNKVELRLRSRFYTQGAASFYQSSYSQTLTYMAIDRELSPLWSETLGAKLTVKLSDRVEFEMKADGFYFSYSNFPLLPTRTGANLGLGLNLTY